MKEIRLFLTALKKHFWNVQLITLLYYIGLVLLSMTFWFFSLKLLLQLSPLLNFYVDIAQPMYQATGTFDTQTLTQVFLFSDALQTLFQRAILFTGIFIVVFSLLRGIRDWLLLQKKQPFYLHILIIFSTTSFLTIFFTIVMKQINSVWGFVLLPILFFILHKYMIIFIQKLVINPLHTKQMLIILAKQLLSWIVLFIALVIIYHLLTLVLFFSAWILLAAMLIVLLLLVATREYYLLWDAGEQS